MDERALKGLFRMIREIRAMTDGMLDETELSGQLVEVAGRGGEIKTWLHKAASANRPLIIELHGGGFALGDARKTDVLRTWIAQSFDVTVVGVNYRLAPEHPFPAAIEDVQDVLAHYAACADDLGIDANQVYLLGYSAGANLSLAVCMSDAPDVPYRVAGCALHYPFFDAVMDPSEVTVRPIDLSPEVMEAFNLWYLGDVDPHEPLVSMVFASDEQLRRLPELQLYPVRGDALAEGAEVLNERLQQLGKACALNYVEDAYHGYIEDEANREVYEALTFPEQIEQRPKQLDKVAEAVVIESLSALLGEPCKRIPFLEVAAAGRCAR